MTVSMAAASATLRVIGPMWENGSTALAGYWGTSDQEGLNP
ncbi:MAG: hypothetical protein OXH50_05940 [Gemmatimonadetes bacterium]|nr:hypothetical protein [Gemmatimonadota bacterium]